MVIIENTTDQIKADLELGRWKDFKEIMDASLL